MDYIHTKEDFEKALGSNKSLLAAHFRAAWAPQCKQVEESLAEMQKDPSFKGLTAVNVEAESVPEISLKYGINAVPTVVLFRNQDKVDRVDGANPAELANKIKAQLDDPSSSFQVNLPTFTPGRSSEEPIEEKLRKLVNAHPCMVFMKGSPSEPKCGFSRTLVGILDGLGVDYRHFDILQDEVVRQELKRFSDWPTYPQVYKDGELLGGLDIIKEMQASGDLAAALPIKQDLNARLGQLVKKSPVMIFMKGDREAPKCKFSRALMEIMKETGVAFDTFDILEDEEVRQGLKTFSDWPTYPQVYVNGDLIGGLDIVKEMKESGELLKALKP